MWQKIDDKQKWNYLISRAKDAHFLQSWQWGEFQKSFSHEVLRFSLDDKIFVQAIKKDLPFSKSYWYVPRGPVIADENADANQALLELFKELKKQGSLFLRVDPISELNVKARRVQSTQPQCTRFINFAKTEDEILKQMHKKTRYNIRLAGRKGVSITQGDIETFIKLNHQTKKRDKFTSHPDEYYRKMARILNQDFLKIWQADYRGEPIASFLVVYFQDTAVYVHGASSNNHKDIMAPHLLHWSVIQDAKSLGYVFYDLYGENPEQELHPAYNPKWRGITRFKRGFGGEQKCYPQSFDLIYSSAWYRVYTLSKKILRIYDK